MRIGSEPIRVLHVVPDLEAGGLQNGVVRLVDGLRGDAFRHEVFCLHGAGPFRARLDPSVRVHQAHAGWHDPRAPLRLARVIRQCRPDVVHARNWTTWPDAVLAKALSQHGRLVFSLHGWDTDVPIRPLRAWACRQLARWTDHLCSVCGHTARLFAAETGLDPGRFEIVPNGVDVNQFGPRSDRLAARRELGVGPGTLVIGSVGRLEPIKDYGLLVRATAELIRRHRIDCELLLVGDGAERTGLERLAGKLDIANRVRVVGWRDDVARLLGAMDVFAMTSRREGMSNAILEAMASGLPVVATSVGGTPEMVEDRVNGRLVRAGDLIGLVGALAELARRPALRQEMAARARLRAVREFSLDRALVRYGDMYRRVIRRGEWASLAGSVPHPCRARPI